MSKPTKTVPGGLVIVFEGLDGVGKTTQLRLAKERLEEAGLLVHETRNLGGSGIGEELRKILLSPVPRPPLTDFYVGAAVQEALAEELEKQREKGAVILIDRGPMSFAVYNAYGGGIDKDLAWHYADQGVAKFKPDLIIFYDLNTEKAIARAETRHQAKDYFENRPLDYFERVDSGFKLAAKRYNAKTVNAEASIEAVNKATMELIGKLI